MVNLDPSNRRWFLVAGLFLFWAGGGCEGADDFSRLTLRLETERDPLPMEPIPFEVTVSNERDRPLHAGFAMMPGTAFFQLHVAEAGEPFRNFKETSWGEIAMFPGKPRTLEPGILRTYEGYLYYDDHKGYVYPAPGAYRIKARLRSVESERTIDSNVLEVEVVEPEGVDAEAYEFLKEAGPILMSAPMRDREEWLKRKEFLERFPDSRYARYIHYRLGRSYSFESDAAWAELEKAAGYEDFFLADDALGLLVEYAAKRGEFDQAEAYLAELERRFPDSTKVLEASGVLRRIRRSHEQRGR